MAPYEGGSGLEGRCQRCGMIADLLQRGLHQSSYISNKNQCELRELVCYRKSLGGEYTRELNRIQKMLEGANNKQSGTLSGVNGKSARNILWKG